MDELAVESERRFRASGKRITRQRSLILRILGQGGGHLDARQIYDRARQEGTRLSMATVYRTLSALREAGVVRELHLDEEHRHYELDGQDGHAHLVCLGCGRVIEADSRVLVDAALATSEAYGFAITRAQLELTGYCAACRSKEPD